MKLVLGNITFEGKIGDANTKAIVHEIAGIIDTTNHDMVGHTPLECATFLGEELCNHFLAYIIPETYVGEIIYECATSLDVHNNDEWEDDVEMITIID